MRLLMMLLAILVSSNTFSAEITNFTSGPSCTDAKNFGWICHHSKEVIVTGQGTCEWNGESKPCTWHGFEFDYKNNEKNTKVECTYKTSHPMSEGNFDGVRNKESDSGEFSFLLNDESGHFYNPQFYILSIQEKEKSIVRTETNCSINGAPAFSYEINAHFPVRK